MVCDRSVSSSGYDRGAAIEREVGRGAVEAGGAGSYVKEILAGNQAFDAD